MPLTVKYIMILYQNINIITLILPRIPTHNDYWKYSLSKGYIIYWEGDKYVTNKL